MNALELRIIPVTPFAQNCSLLWNKDSLEGVVIDPGGEAEKILHGINTHNVNLKQIWLTHGHLDHAGGAMAVKRKTGARIIGPHKDDQFWMDRISQDWAGYGHKGMGENCQPDQYLQDGDKLELGEVKFDVIHCPGHTPGHIVIANKNLKLAFVGDVLFKGSVGRTDFPKSDPEKLVESITKKLWPLGNDMRFVPGHGEISTFGHERKTNPFVGDNVINQARTRSSGIM